MIAIRYELSGGFGPYAEALHREARAIVEAHLEDLRASILQSFEAQKSGETYRRDDGSLYTASAPGEAPAIKEGELFASIEHAMVDDLVGLVWTDDEKAALLNYGDGSLAARPFWEPAIDAAREAFLADMQRLEERIRR